MIFQSKPSTTLRTFLGARLAIALTALAGVTALGSVARAEDRVFGIDRTPQLQAGALEIGADLEVRISGYDVPVRGRVIALDPRGVSLKTDSGLAQFMPSEIESFRSLTFGERFELVAPEAPPRFENRADPYEQSDGLTGSELQEIEYRGRPWADIDPIRTANYNVWCNSTLENAQRYADIMEALFARYDKVFPKMHFPRTFPQGRTRSNVWIHANHQQFMDWTGSPAGVGGFFRTIPELQDVTAYHGSFGATASTDEVLAHEGTHQFQALIFKNMNVCPIWTIEGMAVYFGDGSEISPKEVLINKIPADRLVGLQDAIQNGSYCDLQTLIQLPHRAFSGFHYGHGWGIFYWCFFGNQSEPKAWSGDTGVLIMNEWIVHVRDLDGQQPDHAGNARKFLGILESHTGKSAGDWEAEYKEWILKLEAEPVGKLKGSRWISEKLGLEVKRPPGWKLLRADELGRNEQVAFSASSTKSKRRRISTFVIPKFGGGDIQSFGTRLLQMWRDVEVLDDKRLVEVKVGQETALESYFKGRRVGQQESGVGGDSQAEENPLREYRLMMFDTKDKVYMHMLEVEVGLAEREAKSWENYLANFKILY